jgi:Fe-S-cluster containining protein
MESFECDRCGACCRGHLIVEAELLDVMREPRLLEADPRYAGKSAEAAVSELDEFGRCLLLACGQRTCALLEVDGSCGIYPTRPNACVAMQAGDEQCQYARRAAGLEPLRPASTTGSTPTTT